MRSRGVEAVWRCGVGSHGYLGEGYRVVPRFLKGFGGAGQLVSALQKLVMALGSPYLWGWRWLWGLLEFLGTTVASPTPRGWWQP